MLTVLLFSEALTLFLESQEDREAESQEDREPESQHSPGRVLK